MSATEYIFIAVRGLFVGAAFAGIVFGIPTIWLSSREAAKMARQAIAAGREDVARQLLVGRGGKIFRPIFRSFLPRDLREKFPEN